MTHKIRQSTKQYTKRDIDNIKHHTIQSWNCTATAAVTSIIIKNDRKYIIRSQEHNKIVRPLNLGEWVKMKVKSRTEKRDHGRYLSSASVAFMLLSWSQNKRSVCVREREERRAQKALAFLMNWGAVTTEWPLEPTVLVQIWRWKEFKFVFCFYFLFFTIFTHQLHHEAHLSTKSTVQF